MRLTTIWEEKAREYYIITAKSILVNAVLEALYAQPGFKRENEDR